MNAPVPAASLYEAFATVADPRSRFGRSYTLASLLTLAAAAMLCGCRSLYAIARGAATTTTSPRCRASPDRPRAATGTAPPVSASCTPSSPRWTWPPSRPP